MAKRLRNLQLTGTIGPVCIYQMFGKTCVRGRSSLTRKRVLKNSEFGKTRKYATDFSKAARIGSEIYRALPIDIKVRWLYRAITGEAASLLYAGKDEQEVKEVLWKKYIDETHCRKEEIEPNSVVHSTPENRRQLRKVFLERWESRKLPGYYFKSAWPKRGSFNRKRFREVLEVMSWQSRGNGRKKAAS